MKILHVSVSPVDAIPPWASWLRDRRWGNHETLVVCPHVVNLMRCHQVFDGIGIFNYEIAFSKRRLVNLWYKFRAVRCTLKVLFSQKPDVVVSIENDVLPAVWLYMKLCRKKPRLFMHFYEYLAPGDRMTPWTRLALRCLPPLLKSAKWVSQCNEERLEMFMRDWQLSAEKCHAFHNYPPAWWSEHYLERPTLGTPVRVVLIGSIGLHTMFVREFTDFVIRSGGRIKWDIFVPDASAEVCDFFAALGSPHIGFFKKHIQHEDIPRLFAGYDAGVLLYRGATKNTKYAESNKFYEYMSCGLDVWFPVQLKTLLKYQDDSVYPKVTPLDFEHLNEVDLAGLCSHAGAAHRRPCFSSENAADAFFHELEALT